MNIEQVKTKYAKELAEIREMGRVAQVHKKIAATTWRTSEERADSQKKYDDAIADGNARLAKIMAEVTE